MFKTAFKVAYIGTGYHGFQRQPNLPTIEGELLRAFKKAGISDSPEKSDYSIAGRTDRGVSAIGNVVCLKTNNEATINQINYYLPSNIRIIGHAKVSHGFKPRYAKQRHYRYILDKNSCPDDHLNLELMKQAAKQMEGKHNYLNFSKRSERTPVRMVYRVKLDESDDTVVFDVVGESFLWNMVRKMVKVLIMIGRDELTLNDLETLFNPDIPASIKPVSSEGLILMDVEYDGIEFTCDGYAVNNFMKTLKQEYARRKTILDVEKEMINVLNGL
jgi:tRNA pseudouridine38-40 synthase